MLSLGGYADIFLHNTLPPASCRRSPRSWDHARAAPSTAGHHRLQRDGRAQLHVRDRPDVIKTVTHEEVTKDELGGAMTHNATSGAALRCHGRSQPAPHSRAAFACRATTSTTRCGSDVGSRRSRGRALDSLVPASPNQPRHARSDPRDRRRGRVLQVHRHFAKASSSVARLGGQSVGTSRTSRRTWRTRHRRVGEGRALRPLLRRVQYPLVIRGRADSCPCGAEYGNIIRHGAKLRTFAQATVPKLHITRKAAAARAA